MFLFLFSRDCHIKDAIGRKRSVLSQPVPGTGRLHQRVAVVRRRGTLSVRLRRVVRVLHASALHAPDVQHRSHRGRGHRGRVVRADRVVVPAFPVVVPTCRDVGRAGRRTGLQGIGRGYRGGRVRRGLLT